MDKKIIFFNTHDTQYFQDIINKCDTLLEWQSERKKKMPITLLEYIENVRNSKNIWRVDTINSRNEASFYSRLSMFLDDRQKFNVSLSAYRFAKLVKKLKLLGRKNTIVFGTGPSLEEAMNEDLCFDDSVTIACNSMVKNIELLDKLRPEIIVAADPIFHSGYSSYASAFRKELLFALDRYDAYLITPLRDYKIYLENLPAKYREKIIGIPLQSSKTINFNLLDNFYVKSYPNILTLFMIPIAASISNSISIMGCDGRKMENNEYFWEHHKKSQFNDKMDEIKVAHPAFFNIDYDDYYLDHMKDLDNMILDGEKQGLTFTNITKSHMPCLQRISNLERNNDLSPLNKSG